MESVNFYDTSSIKNSKFEILDGSNKMEIIENKFENSVSEIPIGSDESDTYSFEFLDDKIKSDKELSKKFIKWSAIFSKLFILLYLGV